MLRKDRGESRLGCLSAAHRLMHLTTCFRSSTERKPVFILQGVKVFVIGKDKEGERLRNHNPSRSEEGEPMTDSAVEAHY